MEIYKYLQNLFNSSKQDKDLNLEFEISTASPPQGIKEWILSNKDHKVITYNERKWTDPIKSDSNILETRYRVRYYNTPEGITRESQSNPTQGIEGRYERKDVMTTWIAMRSYFDQFGFNAKFSHERSIDPTLNKSVVKELEGSPLLYVKLYQLRYNDIFTLDYKEITSDNRVIISLEIEFDLNRLPINPNDQFSVGNIDTEFKRLLSDISMYRFGGASSTIKLPYVPPTSNSWDITSIKSLVSAVFKKEARGNKSGLALSPKPVTLKWPHLTSDFITGGDYYVTLKADGIRSLLCYNGSAFWLITEHVSHMLSVRIKNDDQSKNAGSIKVNEDGTTVEYGLTEVIKSFIVEGELCIVEGKYVFIAADFLYYNGRSLTDSKFTERINPSSYVDKDIRNKDSPTLFMNVKSSLILNDVGLSLYEKTIESLNDNTAPLWTKKWGDTIEHSKFFIAMRHIFGLKSQFPTDGLILIPNKPYNDKNYSILKWKPVDLLTVDFLFSIQGENLMVAYLLGQKGELVDPVKKGEAIIFDLKDKKIKDGDIIEMSPTVIDSLTSKQTDEKTILYSYYKNRTGDKVVPNGYWVYEDNKNMTLSPIKREDLIGKGTALFKKAHNRIKAILLENCSKILNAAGIVSPILLDIGSGKGGDLNKWMRNFSEVFAVEPYADNLKVMRERMSKSGISENKVHTIQAQGQDTAVIKSKMTNKKANAVTAFFSLSFFDEGNINKLLETVNTLTSDTSVFAFCTQDKALLRNIFGLNPDGTSMCNPDNSDNVTMQEYIKSLNDGRFNVDNKNRIIQTGSVIVPSAEYDVIKPNVIPATLVDEFGNPFPVIGTQSVITSEGITIIPDQIEADPSTSQIVVEGETFVTKGTLSDSPAHGLTKVTESGIRFELRGDKVIPFFPGDTSVYQAEENLVDVSYLLSLLISSGWRISYSGKFDEERLLDSSDYLISSTYVYFVMTKGNTDRVTITPIEPIQVIQRNILGLSKEEYESLLSKIKVGRLEDLTALLNQVAIDITGIDQGVIIEALSKLLSDIRYNVFSNDIIIEANTQNLLTDIINTILNNRLIKEEEERIKKIKRESIISKILEVPVESLPQVVISLKEVKTQSIIINKAMAVKLKGSEVVILNKILAKQIPFLDRLEEATIYLEEPSRAASGETLATFLAIVSGDANDKDAVDLFNKLKIVISGYAGGKGLPDTNEFMANVANKGVAAPRAPSPVREQRRPTPPLQLQPVPQLQPVYVAPPVVKQTSILPTSTTKVLQGTFVQQPVIIKPAPKFLSTTSGVLPQSRTSLPSTGQGILVQNPRSVSGGGVGIPASSRNVSLVIPPTVAILESAFQKIPKVDFITPNEQFASFGSQMVNFRTQAASIPAPAKVLIAPSSFAGTMNQMKTNPVPLKPSNPVPLKSSNPVPFRQPNPTYAAPNAASFLDMIDFATPPKDVIMQPRSKTPPSNIPSTEVPRTMSGGSGRTSPTSEIIVPAEGKHYPKQENLDILSDEEEYSTEEYPEEEVVISPRKASPKGLVYDSEGYLIDENGYRYSLSPGNSRVYPTDF